MMSIIDWRMSQCEARNLEFRFNTFAQASDITGLDPDLVIITTGGRPNTQLLETNTE
ncbi:MAG: hypothetical protein KC426_04895 [Oceanospirillaceae bacterium]|nr:hypothetical protein [Oceanospirillaceae bacterium]